MDNSKPLDTQDRIKTQLGETTLSNLATGLKAYIVLRVNIEQGNRVVVNVQEMGDNVAKAIMPFGRNFGSHSSYLELCVFFL
jgi:hypothetical protein